MPLIISVQLNSPFKVDISSTEHSNRILTIVKSLPPPSLQNYAAPLSQSKTELVPGVLSALLK